MVDRGPGPARPVARLGSVERGQADLDFRELRRRVLEELPGAWRRFVEHYSRTVYAYAMRLAGGGESREETAQQVYLGVFERLAGNDYRILRSFRGDARFETYLFTVVRNEVTGLRKRRAEQERRHRPYEESPEVEEGGGPGFAESIGLDPERVATIVNESLAALRPRERQVLRMRFYDGLTYRSLAGVFDWQDTNAAAYEVCKILRKLDVLGRCRLKLRWGEPEQGVLLECLRRWLETESGRGS